MEKESKPIRVLVTGSRSWTNREVIADAMALLDMYYEDVTIISGACPHGADRMCEEEAAKLGFKIERHPAQWGKYGKRAGFMRNSEMVESGNIAGVYAFIHNESKGASMTADLAEKAGLKVVRKIELDDV